MKKIYSRMDKVLLFLTILICAFGLIMVFSSSTVSAILRYDYSTTYFFAKQALFMGAAFIFGILFLLSIPTCKYKSLSAIGIIAINGALIYLLVKGEVTNHVQSWFNFGLISIQPSEFAKSIIIIFLACFYDKFFKNKNYNIHNSLIPLTFAVIAFLLTAKQPDFGSAVIIAGIAGMIFISLPFNEKHEKKVLIIVGLFITGLFLFAYTFRNSIFNETQLNRLNYKAPCTKYTSDDGYQVCNGYIAVNNGGLLGAGLGNSTQKYLYLPESHTDFIFAIIVEELGLVGGVAVICTYILLLSRIFIIAKNAHNLRNSIIAYGTFWYIALHIIINLGGVLGIIPLTGVPLPLLSYGGSHTLNVLTMIFLTLRVSVENKTAEYHNEIKRLAN